LRQAKLYPHDSGKSDRYIHSWRTINQFHLDVSAIRFLPVAAPCTTIKAKHNTCFPQTDFGDQLLKSLPIDGRCCGLAEIAVDDNDALYGPAEGYRRLAEPILTLRAFGRDGASRI